MVLSLRNNSTFAASPSLKGLRVNESFKEPVINIESCLDFWANEPNGKSSAHAYSVYFMFRSLGIIMQGRDNFCDMAG